MQLWQFVDNRIAAESVGVNITKYKLLAFSVSAALAGIAGVLYAHNLSTLTALPRNFGYNMSITILVFVVLGGIGNIWGSMIAAGYFNAASGNAQRIKRLSYAYLCDCIDCIDAF